jgi:hypothetical protein
MYGLQAIERVNGKHMVWIEFAEALRVQQLEKIQILRLSIH